MEPKTIEPQDVRPGDRICVAWSAQGIDRTMTLTVAEVDLESMVVKAAVSRVMVGLSGGATITLLDRSAPPPPVEPNRADAEDCEACAALDRPCLYHEGQYAGAALLADVIRAAIGDVQLTDRPAIDPAALWPAADGEVCDERAPDKPLKCTLASHHEGLHAAHYNLGEPPVYCWGDPR